jgi:hypothetical protein
MGAGVVHLANVLTVKTTKKLRNNSNIAMWARMMFFSEYILQLQ